MVPSSSEEPVKKTKIEEKEKEKATVSSTEEEGEASKGNEDRWKKATISKKSRRKANQAEYNFQTMLANEKREIDEKEEIGSRK